MKKDVFNFLIKRYPQIGLKIQRGMKGTEEYKNSVLRGIPLKSVSNDFSDEAADYIESVSTPVGVAEILFLKRRTDFETAIQKLAYKCEPTPIPESMGASVISGLINWEKINQHKKDYMDQGGEDWTEEFSRFTEDKKNYRDSIIILSSGAYSAVYVDQVNDYLKENGQNEILTEEEWIEKSITIRKYHELTHFISQRMFPEYKEAIQDEILADAIGLIAAFGRYPVELAKLFLGLEGKEYREGGRLQNYYFEQEPLDVQQRALAIIAALTDYLETGKKTMEQFNPLIQIFTSVSSMILPQ